MDGLAFIASLASSLAWPIVLLVVVAVFHSQLADLVSRLRKGKIAGLEIEAGEIGEKIKDKLETAVGEAPETTAIAGVARGTGQANAAITTVQTDGNIAPSGSLQATVVRGSSFTADAVLRSLPRAATADELAESVTRYVELRTVPGLRDLSPERIRLEQEFFGAVLELQSLRARGAKPADPARLAHAIDLIRMYWHRPEIMPDEAVLDAADVVRGVIAEMVGPAEPEAS